MARRLPVGPSGQAGARRRCAARTRRQHQPKAQGPAPAHVSAGPGHARTARQPPTVGKPQACPPARRQDRPAPRATCATMPVTGAAFATVQRAAAGLLPKPDLGCQPRAAPPWMPRPAQAPGRRDGRPPRRRPGTRPAVALRPTALFWCASLSRNPLDNNILIRPAYKAGIDSRSHLDKPREERDDDQRSRIRRRG